MLVYKKGDDNTYTEALNKAKAINTKFAQVTMTSRTASDIVEVAGWCLLNERFLSATINLNGNDIGFIGKMQQMLLLNLLN